MAKTPEEKAAEKAAAKQNVAAGKAAKVEELNKPLDEVAVKPLPMVTDKLLQDASISDEDPFTREDYDALTDDEKRDFLLEWDVIDEDGNVLNAEYATAAVGAGQSVDMSAKFQLKTPKLVGAEGNAAEGATLSADEQTEKTGNTGGIVNRQGSVNGDAAVLATDTKGIVEKAANTAGENAGELTDDTKKKTDGAEEVHVRPAHELDQPRDSEADEAARRERIPTSDPTKTRSVPDLLADIVKRLDAIEKKIDVLDREGEQTKADISTLKAKVLDSNTLHGSIEGLKKPL